MVDPTTPVLVGVILALVEGMKYLAKRNGKKNGTSGELDPAYWREDFRKAVKEGVRQELANNMNEFRRLVQEAIRDGLAAHEKEVRKLIQEELSRIKE